MMFEIRKDNRVYCTFNDIDLLPKKEAIKSMKNAGYKIYQDGKLYKVKNTKDEHK